jgi:short-subunit dehydrogenase
VSDSSAPIALVTGASSGIGEASAAELARQGWHVVLVARTASKLEALHTRILEAGGQATVAAVDAADGDAVLEMAATIREQVGPPQLLVNSAGMGAWKYIEDTPPDEARMMIGAPYLAAYNLCHAFMKDMLARRRGVIIHVGSPASFCAWPGATGYVASRCALWGLHEALNQDLRGTGVRSCMVTFGEVTSPYFEVNTVGEDQLPSVGRWVPKTSPEKCGQIIAKLARRPRKNVYHPFLLRLLRAFHTVCPGFTRWMARQTPQRHTLPPRIEG